MIIPDSGDGNHKDDAFVLFFILKELIIPDSGDGNEQRIKRHIQRVRRKIIPDSGDGNVS